MVIVQYNTIYFLENIYQTIETQIFPEGRHTHVVVAPTHTYDTHIFLKLPTRCGLPKIELLKTIEMCRAHRCSRRVAFIFETPH